jgi:hypothetical protein
MSKISLAPDASGSGIFTIASPNSNTNRTLTLPDATGTLALAGAVPDKIEEGDSKVEVTDTGSDGTIVFNTDGSERMRVNNTGQLLIRATAPKNAAGYNLTQFNIATLSATSGGNDRGAIFELVGTAGGSANYWIGALQFYSVTNTYPHAQISSFTDAGTNTGDLRFATNANASSGASTERARITSGGFFKAKGNETNYINTTGSHHEFISGTGDNIIWARSTAASPYGYYVDFTNDPNNAANYVFGADSGGNLVYRIFSNGTTSARSDAKWKKNIETARDGYIDDLARLRVVKYNWHNHEDGTPKEMGLIAQEVEEVFPGLVQEDEEKRDEVRTREIPAVLDEDGNEVEPARTEEYTEQVGTGEYTKSIKFSVFTPMLIKAVQELKAITDTQAQTISALEARIAALEGQ